MATGVNTALIYYSELYKKGTYLLYLMIGTTLLLNICLIPVYGIIGAAIGTGVALLMYNVLKFWLIYKHYNLQPFGNYIYVIVLLFLVCLLVNCFLPHLNDTLLNMIFHSVVVTLIFGFGVIGLKLIPFKKDLFKFS
jgi:O-antigen/teichoic acid export membrane protein